MPVLNTYPYHHITLARQLGSPDQAARLAWRLGQHTSSGEGHVKDPLARELSVVQTARRLVGLGEAFQRFKNGRF